MNLIKDFKLGAIAAITTVALSSQVNAANEAVGVGFTTVPDITLIEVAQMDFGAGLYLAANSECDMLVSDHTGTGYAGDAALNISRDSDEVADAGYALLGTVDTDCLSGAGVTGTPGIYEITGVAGGSVNVSVNDIAIGAATDFAFTATGCVTNYIANADGDLCEDITGSGTTPVTVRIADASDTVGNGGLGAPVPGKAYIVVGGSIQSKNLNVSNAALTEQITIDVTY